MKTVFVVGLGVIVLVVVLLQGYSENKTECNKKGGQLIRGSDGLICVKVEVVK